MVPWGHLNQIRPFSIGQIGFTPAFYAYFYVIKSGDPNFADPNVRSIHSKKTADVFVLVKLVTAKD